MKSCDKPRELQGNPRGGLLSSYLLMNINDLGAMVVSSRV